MITTQRFVEYVDRNGVVYDLTFNAFPYMPATLIDPPEGGPDLGSFRVKRDGEEVSYWGLSQRLQEDLEFAAIRAIEDD